MLTESEKNSIAQDAVYRGEFRLLRCSRGVLGYVTHSSIDREGRIVLHGFQKEDHKKKWQSVCPTK